ncbi:unnamed protein product [Victoria cruziana]
MAVLDSFIFSILLLSIIFIGSASGLRVNYYSHSCPQALVIIKEGVHEAVTKETRMGASLLRLHFHDCFVNGCDGSILLDHGEGGFTSEKEAPPNNNSVRGYEVIYGIKARLEKVCPEVVSCADIVAVAARDSVVELGGRSWRVRLGRKDATTANASLAMDRLPSPDSNLAELRRNFKKQHLSVHDMIVLSGGHTIGKARCTKFREALYEDGDMIDPSHAASLQGKCPEVTGNNNTLFPMDVRSENVFDNHYYKNLMRKKGLFRSDRVLYNGGKAGSIVAHFAHSQESFFKKFGLSMIRMGRIKPAAGTKLEIRRDCRKPNSVL